MKHDRQYLQRITSTLRVLNEGEGIRDRPKMVGDLRIPMALMTIPSQPTHIRPQDRIDHTDPVELPSNGLTRVRRRPEGLCVLRLDQFVRADIEDKTSAVGHPDKIV